MSNPIYIKYRRPNASQAHSDSGRRFLLRRAVIQWLMKREDTPGAIGLDVPTGMVSDRADIAALWSSPVRIEKRNLLMPSRSLVVVCALTRSECYAASVNPDALINEMRYIKKRLVSLEEIIRQEEPLLRDTHSLFEEYADWDYEHSQNMEYQTCRARAKEISEKLYRGTRMERIQRNKIANELYVAIPEGILFPDEVMPEWGIITVSEDYVARMERKAPVKEASPDAQLHLAQKIAASNRDYLTAAMGFRKRKR